MEFSFGVVYGTRPLEPHSNFVPPPPLLVSLLTFRDDWGLVLYAIRADDKKLTTTLKRIGVTNIPAIEEVNMFKNDGEVIHFVGPKGD